MSDVSTCGEEGPLMDDPPLEIEEVVTLDPNIVVPDEIEERLADEDDEEDE